MTNRQIRSPTSAISAAPHVRITCSDVCPRPEFEHVDINTLVTHEATQLGVNAIGVVELALLEPIAALPYKQSRVLGSLVLVDTASHKTSGAALIL